MLNRVKDANFWIELGFTCKQMVDFDVAAIIL